jgi:alpha-D-xyloside xylohydrolase
MVMDFANDTKAVNQPYQYMFGNELLIAPVTEANVTNWNVYLPQAAGWYDYWTGKHYAGGLNINAAAPQDKIPVFVKAGAIIPMAKTMQYTSEKPWDVLEIRIYKGANGAFSLYEDEGDGYNYEKGSHTLIPFKWDDKAKTLTIGARAGTFANYLKSRTFNIVMVSDGNGAGLNEGVAAKSVNYTGKPLVIKE